MLDGRPCNLIALVDAKRDRGKKPERWSRWRPVVAIAGHGGLPLERVDLVAPKGTRKLAKVIAADIEELSPGVTVEVHPLDCRDSDPFGQVRGAVDAWVASQPFAPEVSPIVLHAGRTASPLALALWRQALEGGIPGVIALIDAVDDPNAEDALVIVRTDEQPELVASGVDPHASRPGYADPEVIATLDVIATVARGGLPITLAGPSGSGRGTVARWVHSLRSAAGVAPGRYVEVDCGTLAETERATLFGASGALAQARGGTVVLRDPHRLAEPVQRALARALHGLGSPAPVALTSTDPPPLAPPLAAALDGWRFALPPVAARPRDVASALDRYLGDARRALGRDIRFADGAAERYLAAARHLPWPAGFRSLRTSVLRLASSADGTIGDDELDAELERLAGVGTPRRRSGDIDLPALLGEGQYAELDRFDRVQLEDVVRVCRESASLSEAGRTLFAVSRTRRKTVNDADRVRKYLLRFGLTFDALDGEDT